MADSLPLTQVASAADSSSANAAVPGANSGVISADTEPKPAPVSREDVIAWSLRGVSDEVIIDRIDRGGCAFQMCTSEEIHLHDAGVTDEVLRAVKAANR